MSSAEMGKAVLVNWNFPLDQAYDLKYRGFLEQLEGLYAHIRDGSWDKGAFDNFLGEFIKDLGSGVGGYLRVFHDGHAFKKSTVSTCLNVSILAFAYGTGLKWDPVKTKRLVRAALLHDVGMFFLPEEILLRSGRVNDQERSIIESHPSTSYELLKSWGEEETLCRVGLQHHESWSGDGYPKRIRGDEIDNFSQIIAVGVVFTAMMTDREYRNSMVGYLAMKSLIQDQGHRFNPVILKNFVSVIGLNPPGSIVLLSDGSLGRVIENNPGNPIRPKVRVLIDSVGSLFREDTGPVMDLEILSKLFIARPVNFQDILQGNEV